MASAAARSGLRSLAARAKAAAPARRGMSSSVHDDAYETAKWEKITYVGIVTCTLLAAYNLSKGHPHHEEPPVKFRPSFLRVWISYGLNLMCGLSSLFVLLQAYPYLHIRNKEFPWGPDGLFESKHH